MATIQLRGKAWRVLFQYQQQRHAITIGKVTKTEAIQWSARVDHLLMRVKQRMLEVPQGVSITDFILHDGKPPAKQAETHTQTTTLGQLTKAYTDTLSNGAIEANTLYTLKIHIAHLEETLGKNFLLSGLSLASLQSHVDRRSKDVAAVTIRKEITNFRAAWNWGERMKLTSGTFPSAGLVYPKGDEKLPFMTWDEIERRIKAGGDPAELWECLYLDATQVKELLDYAQKKPAKHWVYPMIVTAYHSGARRSELIRMMLEDVDLESRTLTIKEKKRDSGMSTTRRVPISDRLAEALKPLMAEERLYLFGPGKTPLTVDIAKQTWQRTFKNSKWASVPGWHVARHSICSIAASQGIDQRIIDDWVGHSTDEQRRRYRHLAPSTHAKAINQLFGEVKETPA